MTNKELFEEILDILNSVKEDEAALEKINSFLLEEIYDVYADEKIPEKFQKTISSIADSISASFICFLNLDTLEVEELPEVLVDDPEEFESITGENYESWNTKHENWEHCIEIRPLVSHDSYKIMELFVEEVDDEKFKNRLQYALNNRKPFAHFGGLIDDSEYRQDWFDFRQKQLEQFVWQQIKNELDELNGKIED